jgi:hypothetical protein
MLFQSELPTWVTDYFEPALWWMTVGLFLLMGFFILKKMRENDAAKQFMSGLVSFAFLFGIARAIENIRRYTIATARFDIIEGWIGTGPLIAGPNMVLRILYYVVSWMGISLFYYYSEKYVFKQKYYFTAAAISEGTVSILMYFGFTGTVMIILLVLACIGFLFAAVIPVMLYLRLSVKNPGEIGKASLFAGLGLALFASGVMADLPQSSFVIYLVNGVPLDPLLISVLAPILASLGAIIMYYAYQKMFKGLF